MEFAIIIILLIITLIASGLYLLSFSKITMLKTELDTSHQEQLLLTQKFEQTQQEKEYFLQQNAILQIKLQSKEDEMNSKLQSLKAEYHIILQAKENETAIKIQAKEEEITQQKEQLLQIKQSFKAEFNELAQQILDEKSKKFDESQQKSLSQLLNPLREQIKDFKDRVDNVHSENLKENSMLSEQIKQIMQTSLMMSKDAKNLTNALKGNNKTAGNWGEIQLENALQNSGLIKGESYDSQASLKNDEGKTLKPDFIVHLPDGKHLVLDSKVSLLDYEKFCDPEGEHNEIYLKNHCNSIRKHISDLSSKDYSNLIGLKSPEFVLMFIPIESAYIEALKADQSLFEDAYRKNIILVSYTTLIPILKTVANLWRVERSNTQAQEIGNKAGEIYTQVAVVAENLAKLGNTLNTVNNHYNNTITSLAGNRGLYKKVSAFKELSAKSNSKELKEIAIIENSCETFKINPILTEVQEENKDLERIEIIS